jgi:hypothetical protein
MIFGLQAILLGCRLFWWGLLWVLLVSFGFFFLVHLGALCYTFGVIGLRPFKFAQGYCDVVI